MIQPFKFIRYFFFLLTNWNLRIAIHIIRQEIKGEKKYNINTTGADELESLEKKGIDVTHATIYMPASYDLLEDIYSHLTHDTIGHIVDIGCGKGRVLCVAAHFGIMKVTGVDLSADFCNAAKLNLAKVKLHYPELQYQILNNDAFYFDIPEDADCIFLFNPFDETIMSGVIENIEISLEEYPRDLTLIYFNPLNKELFTKAGFSETYHAQKLNYLEASVMKRKQS